MYYIVKFYYTKYQKYGITNSRETDEKNCLRLPEIIIIPKLTDDLSLKQTALEPHLILPIC